MLKSPSKEAALATPELTSRGVLAFANIDWNGTWYSRHQILWRIAKICPVVVVDHPRDLRDAMESPRGPYEPLHAIAPNLWAYQAPRFLPGLYRPAAARNVLAVLQAFHLRLVLRRIGLHSPICYVWHPEYAPAVDRLPRWFSVYHCYDKFDAYHAAPASAIRSLETKLVGGANLVLASSRVLAADLERRTGRPVRYLPHGVDFEYFRERVALDPTPPDLNSVPRPRIGYVARLDERIDDEALKEIATKRPSWSVVIIGGSGFQSAEGRARFRALAKLPNVHVLGERPRAAIPAYIAGLDVCLMCYRTDNWGRWVQPIKAYEYLACGRPVVSSPIDAALDFGELVSIVPKREDWISAIEAALNADKQEIVSRRLAFARQNTWDARVTELACLIESRLSAVRAVPEHATGSEPC